eukprot:gnl/TRDRNA2_/TRDRNA2_77289_c0_seq1.p1 gnl/TRDRNA2_/TRDRNA2_77289_c0~~gnl/TRDRNA2_/TRDRNA2_77289_c0_seq1.p1  ORF type:complete len:105 (+),score=10.96 gnl/TRDRNA2_/TRDRNA2_77289_c0_seq1:44-316(+)
MEAFARRALLLMERALLQKKRMAMSWAAQNSTPCCTQAEFLGNGECYSSFSGSGTQACDCSRMTRAATFRPNDFNQSVFRLGPKPSKAFM